MRSKPIVEWIIFIVMWGLLIIPLWHFTQSRPVIEPRSISTPLSTNMVSTWATLRFSPSPVQFALTQGQTILWQDTGVSEQVLEKRLDIRMEHFITEITIKADWADTNILSIAELGLAPDGMDVQKARVWVHGHANDIMEFRWQP